MARSTSLARIYQDAGRHEPPTVEEEKDLVRRVAAGDKEAEAELITRNLRLVMDVARRYQTPGASDEDLVQEGAIGLIKAARKFDPKRGYRFSTFAHWWVRQAISRFVKGPTRVIRLPEYLQDRIARTYRAKEDLAQEVGRDPSAEEVGRETGMDADAVQELMLLSRDASSLDAPVGGSDAITVEQTVEDEFGKDPEVQAFRNQAHRAMVRGLGRLKPRDTRILAYRYGLADGKNRSRPWIGKKLGISAERVRQLEKNALRSLRSDVDTELKNVAA